MPQAKIAVIGGTGLYDIEGVTDTEEVNIDTPFGKPSDSIGVGKLGGVGIAFLPRHGRGHRISPTEVPSRANIYALKSLGVEHIIAINSCGSFKEEIKPGHLLIPDQTIDRTRSRVDTFFGDGIVVHIQFADDDDAEFAITRLGFQLELAHRFSFPGKVFSKTRTMRPEQSGSGRNSTQSIISPMK